MVNVTEAEIMQEVAEAEEQGLKAQHSPMPERVDTSEIQGFDKMTYQVPPEDQAAWVPAWELKVDIDGEEYGVPCKLARNQLGHYLMKKREVDGGRRFTVRPPARMAAQAQFACFANEQCRKKVATRGMLYDHIMGCHPGEAKIYADFMEDLRHKIAADNPRLAKVVERIVNQPDPGGVQAVPVHVRQQIEESLPEVDETLGADEQQNVSRRVGPELFYCQEPDCNRFFDSNHGRQMHVKLVHKRRKR